MAKFDIDLTSVQDIKPIPSGTYVLKILEVDGDKKSKTGNPKMVIKAEILAPASVAKDQKYYWFSLSLVESAWFRIKNLVECVGLPVTSGGFDSNDLLNKEVGATIVEENSKEFGHRNNVTGFLKAKETKPEVAPAAPEGQA